MTIDVEALLRRVVAEVFDADVEATYSTERDMYRVRLSSADGLRHAGLRASYEWFDVTVFDVDPEVSTFEVDYDDLEEDKEAALRRLALVVRAYLRDGGRIEHRRGLVRRHMVVVIAVDDREWTLRPTVFRRRKRRQGTSRSS